MNINKGTQTDLFYVNNTELQILFYLCGKITVKIIKQRKNGSRNY